MLPRRRAGSSYAHVETTDIALPLCQERSRIIAQRIQFSRQWTCLFTVAIVLNGILLLWTVLEATTEVGDVVDPPVKRAVFCAFDSVVTAFVLAEVSLNWMTQGAAIFCSQCSNWVDGFVAALSMAALGMALAGPAAKLEEDEEVEAVVMLVRYVAQLLRLGVVVRSARRQARKNRLDVDLTFVEIDPLSDEDPLRDGMPASARRALQRPMGMAGIQQYPAACSMKKSRSMPSLPSPRQLQAFWRPGPAQRREATGGGNHVSEPSPTSPTSEVASDLFARPTLDPPQTWRRDPVNPAVPPRDD